MKHPESPKFETLTIAGEEARFDFARELERTREGAKDAGVEITNLRIREEDFPRLREKIEQGFTVPIIVTPELKEIRAHLLERLILKFDGVYLWNMGAGWVKEARDSGRPAGPYLAMFEASGEVFPASRDLGFDRARTLLQERGEDGPSLDEHILYLHKVASEGRGPSERETTTWLLGSELQDPKLGLEAYYLPTSHRVGFAAVPKDAPHPTRGVHRVAIFELKEHSN
jgi:hypothetical protein